jgi:hypothetical protein
MFVPPCPPSSDNAACVYGMHHDLGEADRLLGALRRQRLQLLTDIGAPA